MKNFLIFTAGAMTMFGLFVAGMYGIETDDTYGETFFENDDTRIRINKNGTRIKYAVFTDKTVAE